ncbi:MAG: AAA family ATPase [Coriobacteriales bacterium]|jgi:energy-coupling factor transporter ATP-binding protein EcfA2
MLNKIKLKNFKAQEDAELDLGKFTVFTGLNAAGKTTVLQALVFLKQSLSRKEVTYNDYLLKLGDFKEVVHGHDISREFDIDIDIDHEGTGLEYGVTVGQERAAERFLVDGTKQWSWDSMAPYAMEPAGRLFLTQAAEGYGGGQYESQDNEELRKVIAQQKALSTWFDNMLYLSSSRGFTKYSYPLMAGQPEPEEVAKRAGDASLLEEWLANLIMYRINEAQRYPDMRGQLDVMRERLGRLGVDINPYVMSGPSVVIDLTEKDMWVSAVNSGYGINQAVSFITLGTLLPKGTLIMVEEPEIHLHPKIQRVVCEILAEIADEGKQVIITSHSDHFLKTLNKRVKDGKMDKNDVKVFNFVKKDHITTGEEIDVSDSAKVDEMFA